MSFRRQSAELARHFCSEPVGDAVLAAGKTPNEEADLLVPELNIGAHLITVTTRHASRRKSGASSSIRLRQGHGGTDGRCGKSIRSSARTAGLK